MLPSRVGGGALVWINVVVLIINISSQKVKESIFRHWVSIVLCSDSVLHSQSLLLFFFLFFSHLEIGIEETKSANDEDDEEVNDFEGDISLHV